MGSACSHHRFEVFNIDPNIYNETEGVWKFKVADAQCVDCKERLRAIKKTCVDHNIPQPWELTDHHICKHDMIIIRHKKKDEQNKRFTGRSECVACLTSVPVYVPYEIVMVNNKPTIVRQARWEVDVKMLNKEREDRIKKMKQ
ncbi:hypothetical protein YASMINEVIRUS_433 [Yasminevirus sp. GU-2018]|uniref:Uncharacterized protein n=1 Tax=Yasminevirus sp. GU-2018 TaxID=2420051 RepID=A0A5K0U834_9VIRU|nr:hypothetical protein YASMINEVIRUS_433 [Yasminevirus sp. GU-2018]